MKIIEKLINETPNYKTKDISVKTAQNFLINLALQINKQKINFNNIEEINIENALNKILAEDIKSPLNIPPHDNSAMDGYAFDIKNIDPQNPSTLKIIGKALAGAPYTKSPPQKGECLQITTGAKIPEGVNTVIPQENVEINQEKNTITINPNKTKENANIRKTGEDIKQGEIALQKGTKITPTAIGLIASLGLNKTKIYKKLKITIITTGDEIIPLGQNLKEGQIYNSNQYSISAEIQKIGFEIIDTKIIKDNPQEIKSELINSAEKSDVIITSGGASFGQADYARKVLTEIQEEKIGEIAPWQIAMRPGRPFVTGYIKNALFIGLPGNPVAALLSLKIIAMPALIALAQNQTPEIDQGIYTAICAQDINKKVGRTEYIRAKISPDNNGIIKASPLKNQGSAMLSGLTAANGLIILEEKDENIKTGDIVKIIFI